jgi:hypothetical protein
VLCEQAANEQNPDRLLELIKEINRLLEGKQQLNNDSMPREIGNPQQ